MANPQLEHGYTRIANEIMEALARTNLSPYQSRILFVIWRKTYGWNKKRDKISISQIVSASEIHKSHVSRTLKQLVQRNIVTRTGNKIEFNKNYTQWRELPKLVTVTNIGNKKLPVQAGTKEKKEKKNISKEKAYRLPQKEEIEESSRKKLTQDLEEICMHLKGIWPQVFAFKGKMLKQGVNKRALLHALSRCYLKKEFDKRGPWGYCTNILKVEDGNYNERDHRKA